MRTEQYLLHVQGIEPGIRAVDDVLKPPQVAWY